MPRKSLSRLVGECTTAQNKLMDAERALRMELQRKATLLVKLEDELRAALDRIAITQHGAPSFDEIVDDARTALQARKIKQEMINDGAQDHTNLKVEDPNDPPLAPYEYMYHLRAEVWMWKNSDDKKLVIEHPEHKIPQQRMHKDGTFDWELPGHWEFEKWLDHQFFPIYQRLWREQRVLAGVRYMDPFWAWSSEGARKYNPDGCYCHLPQGQVMIPSNGSRPMEGIGYIDLETKRFEVNSYNGDSASYTYLEALEGDALTAELDRLILGQ